jgi:long-chain acyl-CoA synthetase
MCHAESSRIFHRGRISQGKPPAAGDDEPEAGELAFMLEDQISDLLNSLPTRISEIVTTWAERSPDRPALVEAESIWTYRQLSSAIAVTAAWLVDRGVRPGDRVMIVCENCQAFVAVLMALATLDAWPVLVNARLSPREIDQIRDHCGARRIIYTTDASPHAADHAKRSGAVIERTLPFGSIAIGPINELVEPEPLEVNPANNVAAIIYTSGTTGLPKGVMLTHRNLLFVAAVSSRIRSLTPDDRVYGVLPMSHAVGLSVVLLGSLLSGATLYLAPRFDPVAARSTLETAQLSVMLGVPSMFAQILEYAKLRGLNSLKFPALRIISASGAPLDADLKARTEAFFGLPLYNGYGVTECSPNIAQARIEAPRSDTSVGEIFPGTEVKLVGPDRKQVAEGESGELWVRGPHVMKGYYRAADETANAVDAEGWFNTRDLARLEGRNLFIIGRTKELIVRFGFNVYPAEVEGVLNAHPAVARAAVIGRPAEGSGGEEVIAFVELRPDSSATASDLAQYAADLLSPYKRPSHIFLVSGMPLTPTGKIVKGELAKLVDRAGLAR